jgi:DNA-binding MarR family transcriptional regulator
MARTKHPTTGCAGALLELNMAITRIVQHEIRRRHGLSLQEVRALIAVSTRSARTPSALAEYLCLAPATITKLIDQLTQQALMTRRPVPGDRRCRRLELTRAGRARLRATFVALRAQIALHLESLPEGDTARVGAAVASLWPYLTLPPVHPSSRPARREA